MLPISIPSNSFTLKLENFSLNKARVSTKTKLILFAANILSLSS